MVVDYKPYKDRTHDTQYRDALIRILQEGIRGPSTQGTDTLTLFGGLSMAFDFENGFPLITERSIMGFWKQSLGEMCCFINGGVTLEELHDYGCTFWDKFATEKKCAKRKLPPGHLGEHSYGGAFANFPTEDGKGFNQFKHIVEQIKELPDLRTHYVSPWYPPDIVRGEGKQQKLVVAPCHGWVHARILNGGLYLHMMQRSADFPVGVPSNMAQYAALTLMLAHVTGYPAKRFTHTFSDAHIYVDQIPQVEEMIAREPKRFPTVTLKTEGIESLFDFRKEHFELDDYDPHPSIREIPVAI
ncbi:MAG: thyA [Patescibacteria group bacterium]|jgi:thymidylate synthase|nr:thyA [Patescibacteria group bacterium]